MKTWLLGAIAVPFALAAGCDRPATAPDDRPVELRTATYADLDQFLTGHQGEVVLIDFWATWCGPCRERFPHLVALYRKYEGRGLVCASVSLDDPDDEGEAREFLTRRRATFSNFLWKDFQEERESFVSRFGFRNAIPHMALFDRDGTRVWDSAERPLSPDGVEELVHQVLSRDGKN